MGNKCECLLSGNKEIPYREGENIKSDVVYVFESPGETELREGKMLCGRSYYLLKDICKRVGLPLDDKYFLMNACRCKLDTKILSDGQISKILDSCRTKFVKAMKFSDRKLIVCFGRIAFRQVMRLKTPLNKARNNFWWSNEFNCYVYCTYHPAAILRNPSRLPLFLNDLEKIRDFIKSGYKPNDDVIWKEVDTIEPLLNGGLYKLGNSYVTALDTETQGVDWYDPNSIVISYSIAVSPREGWNIILYEEVEKDKGDFNIIIKRGGTLKKPNYVEIGVKRAKNYYKKIEELKELLKSKDIKKYFMNIKYELHRFKNLGIDEFNNCCLDIKCGAHVLDSELYRDASLADLTGSFCDITTNHKNLLQNKDKSDMLLLLKEEREVFNKYACLDAVYTLRVGLKIRELLLRDKKSANYYVNLVHPAETELLFEIERNGVKVDIENIQKIKKEIEVLKKEQEENFKKYCPKKVYERYKDNFILTRKIILREALFKWTDRFLRKDQTEPEVHDYGFGLEPIEVSEKTGEPLVDKKKVLFYILNGNYSKRVKNLVSAYLKWSEYDKLISNYINNIEKLSSFDGRLHPSASVSFTSSGRTAFRKPALQTIPKRSDSANYIRKLFIAPEDYYLVEVDYKVSELRWVAHVADDEQFQEIFKRGVDPHKATASLITGKKITEIDKKERQSAKPMNFGMIYGMSPSTLKIYALQDYGVKFTLKQAEEVVEKWFSFYKEIRKWHNRSREQLNKNGYLRSVFGRKRILRDYKSQENWVKEQAYRTGINFEIQSPSSDAALLGGINILRDKTIDKSKCRIVLFIHDALVFEVHKDYLEYALPKIKYHMTHIPTEKFGFTLKVPLDVEIAIGKNLAEMEEKDVG